MAPFVSVVILSPEPPESLLVQLANQTYKNFEIIIAREKGIVNAMNKALDRAKGEIFVRIDDDVELPTHWLESIVDSFNFRIDLSPGAVNELYVVGGVTGSTFIPHHLRKNRDSILWAENPRGILKWLYDNNEFKPGGIRKCGCVSYDSNYAERFNDHKGRIDPDYLEGTNWAMATRLIREAGGFDPKFDGVAEWFDTDVVFKIKKLGYKMVYSKKAHLNHMIRKGDAHFSERFEGLGRIKNFLRFHWRHGRHRFLNIKFYVYLTIWMGYFVCKRLKFL